MQLCYHKGYETDYCVVWLYCSLLLKIKKMKQLLSFVSDIFLYDKYFIVTPSSLSDRHDIKEYHAWSVRG